MRSAAPVQVRLTTTPPAPWPDAAEQAAPPPMRYRRTRVALALVLTAALAVPVWRALHPLEGAAALTAPVVVDDGTGTDQGVLPDKPGARVVPVVAPAPVVDRGPAAAPGTGAAGAAGNPACTAPCTTSQVVSVEVLPGPFTVEAGTVVLRRDGDLLDGTTTASVTDLRGSPVPWTLSLRWDGTARDASGRALAVGTLRVAATCERTDGPLTVRAVDPVTVSRAGVVPLCEAPVVAQGSLAGGLVDVGLQVSASGIGDADVLDGATLGFTWVLAAA